MKYFDSRRTFHSESICQGCFHLSRTKVLVSKTIRYRPSLNYKLYRPGSLNIYILSSETTAKGTGLKTTAAKEDSDELDSNLLCQII